MKLSIFTTVTNPLKRGDAYHQAIRCYKDLADEVIVVNGGGQITEQSGIKYVNWKWPKEFDWKFIGQQFQRGYNACTGDWVIRMDIDTILHEEDFSRLRQELEVFNDYPAVSLFKRQFILPDRFNVKSRLVVAVNKRRYGDRARFDSGGDLCQVSVDGTPLAIENMYVPQVRIPLYNYECLLKTKEQLLDDKGRFARAWQQRFNEFKLGGPDNESAYEKWLSMVIGRINKPQQSLQIDQHPKYIQETIRNLKPEQWGFNGLGHLEGSRYVSSY